MKSSFPGFFANGLADISKLWQECLFVLDANVLLSLYRFSDATRSELVDVFKSLQGRLWIPHQVASEYLNNRLAVIGEQLKAYDDAVKQVEAIQKSLDNLNQAPFVSVSTQKDAAKIFKKLIDEFKEKREVHNCRIYSDDIKDALEELFSGRVGKPFSREDAENYIKRGADRYAESIPPGYADKKKGGSSDLFVDRCKPYGDYFVWLQMLDKAKADNVSIIFITGDVKDDWWSNFQGKTIGPLPALIEEFQVETERNFYMYTPHRFLERANEHLKKEVSQIAVDEIKNSERHDDSRVSIWPDWNDARRLMIEFNRGRAIAEQLHAERKELLRKGKALRERHLRLSYHRAEVLKQRENLVPELDDQQILSMDEEVRALDNELTHLLAELEYARVMMNDCNHRINEVRSELDDADDR